MACTSNDITNTVYNVCYMKSVQSQYAAALLQALISYLVLQNSVQAPATPTRCYGYSLSMMQFNIVHAFLNTYNANVTAASLTPITNWAIDAGGWYANTQSPVVLNSTCPCSSVGIAPCSVDIYGCQTFVDVMALAQSIETQCLFEIL
jgi:hypothetical protein